MTRLVRSVRSRILLVTAVAVLVVAVFGTAVLGAAPQASESGPGVVAWFREHAASVRWFVWAGTVGVPLYAVMIALLRGLLPAPHRDVFLIGGVVLLVATSLQSWIWAGLALHASALDPAVARSVLDVAIFFGPVLTGATMTMIAPVTIAAFCNHHIPKWLGVIGAIAFLEQAAETITIFSSTGFTEPGGAMNMQLGAGLTLLWLFAFGVWGGLRGRPDHLLSSSE